MQTVMRSWTIATWLVAGVRDDVELVGRTLADQTADAVVLQSIRERDVAEVAASLGMQHAWSLSHYPASRLFGGSALGLAVLSPHPLRDVHAVVTSPSSSTWSKHRRIMQIATVERGDRSGYRIRHAVDALREVGTGGAPLVSVHPARIDGDASRAIELPHGAEVVSLHTHQPAAEAAKLLVVTFEMPWVAGDFPTNVR